jgi:hypothetical protein
LSGNISRVQELNLDRHLETGRLLRTYPEVWKELKTTSGQIPSRNQQKKGYSGLCPKQRGTGNQSFKASEMKTTLIFKLRKYRELQGFIYCR